MYGYAGKLLFVNLTDGTFREEQLSPELAKDYLGGYGIGAKVLFDRMKPGADPLGPDNILGFVTAPFNATGTLFGGRYMVVCKSPVTGGWNDANSGGYFAPELKKAGFDAVFVEGKSEKPVYIWIKDGKYELRDASELWGLDVKETWEKLKEVTGEPRVRAAVIGPAGEHLSLFAAVMNDGHRAAGRGGVGAVMGSKNLKAVACRGTLDIPVADKKTLVDINKDIASFIANPPEAMAPRINSQKMYGTTAGTAVNAMSGDSPVKNWAGSGVGDFGEEKASAFDPMNYSDKYIVKPYGCAACPLRCGAEYKVTEGKWPVGDTERPEYETQAAFGSNCLCDDMEAVIKCNELCNRGGFDTITAGSVVAWAMECYEKGILTAEDFDGIKPVWGDSESMVAVMQKIYDDEGCGKKLKLGQLGAANAYGKGHECLSVAGGIEPGMHDARMPGVDGFVRVYQYDPTPGRHMKGGAKRFPGKFEDRGSADVEETSNCEVQNAVGLCAFSGACIDPAKTAEIMTATTGTPYTREDLLNAGIRIFMVRQSFNIREGITRDKMWISPRLTGRPAIESGPNKDIVLPNEEMADIFYETIGCDIKTGIPKKETLEKLGGLEEVIKQLY